MATKCNSQIDDGALCDKFHHQPIALNHMSTSKLDTSGVFHPLTLKASKTQLNLCSNNVSIRKNGIEFHSAQPIPIWTEMSVELQSVKDMKKLHCTGVVVACQGTRHAGYHVSMVFMNLSRQSQERLSVLAFSQRS